MIWAISDLPPPLLVIVSIWLTPPSTQGSDVTLNLVRWNFACWCRTTLKRVGRPYREQWIWSQLDQSFLWSAMNVSLGRVCCIESVRKLLQRNGLVVASWSCTIQYCNGSWTSQQEFNDLDIETSSFRLKWISKKGFLKFIKKVDALGESDEIYE